MPAPLYRLKVRSDFAAAHILHGYDGPCSRLHGHNWVVEVEVTARSLDDIGMGMDFQAIKICTRELIASVDHYFLNDLPAFAGMNPTAENVARYFYRELKTRIDHDDVTLSSVTIWETDNSAVTYSED